MSRPVTSKYLQQHVQCVCGYGVVDGYTATDDTHKNLVSMGYKRKKSKKDGSVFYNKYYYLPQCLDDHNQFD